jgi:uncharacterized integral membrane protein (TIGR00698 family)
MEDKQLVYKTKSINFFLLISLTAIFFTSNAVLSILLGIFFSFFLKPSKDFFIIRIGSIPLQFGVVLLGFTMNIPYAINIGSDYFVWILLFVIFVFLIGLFISIVFKIEKNIAYLLTAGTAICGGTAIAAVAPIIKAKPEQVFSSITVIFLLNSIAIISFPILGSYLNLNSYQFGVWSALAIHDTSSVIASALSYSNESAQVAATIKILRTLWIVPLVLISGILYKNIQSNISFPKFILFFVMAILFSSILNLDENITLVFRAISQYILLFGLFCIGSQSSILDLKKLNYKSLFFALCLWLVVIPTSYIVIVLN